LINTLTLRRANLLKPWYRLPGSNGGPPDPQSRSSVAQQGAVDRKAAIYAAFYHRTRRKFVLWTTEEIANRTGIPLLSVAAHLRCLKDADEARSIASSETSAPKSWYLTPRGQSIANTHLGAAINAAIGGKA
jgi:hypothetical protein